MGFRSLPAVRLSCLLVWVLLRPLWAQPAPRASVEFARPTGAITIEADRIERLDADHWTATGKVRVAFKDIEMTTETLLYNSSSEEASTPGPVRFSQGLHWITAARVEMNMKTESGTFYEAEGFTDQEFFFKARLVRRDPSGNFIAEDAFVTACKESVPKWSFSMRRADIRPKENVIARNTFFRVRNVPIFYLPWARVPLERKRRASGFLLPGTGTSNNKGRRISQSYYLTLGESADVMLVGDYFSERGLGYGTRLRARPNAATEIDVNGYVMHDRLDQGGGLIAGQAQSVFENGFRAVASFNLVSNFAFRQVFSETFRAATAPDQNSSFFLSNHSRSFTFDISLTRLETFFPARSVVVRSAPRIDFGSVGADLGGGFYLQLESSAEGLNRTDALLRTPEFVQRLDFFPRLRHRGLQTPFLSLSPRIGFRETFYSDGLRAGESTLAAKALSRHYAEVELNALGPVLEKDFAALGKFRHRMETEVTYRRIDGIGGDYHRALRFDERDAVADTEELEYAVTHRLITRGNYYGEGETNLEAASFRLSQKYFLDETFGGAFRDGFANQFYPLNTLTGFYYATERRQFSPVTALFRLNPSYRYSLDLRGDYDIRQKVFRNASVTGYAGLQRWWAGLTYFVTRRLTTTEVSSNQLQALISYGEQWKGLSVATQFNYDLQSTSLQNSITRINYFWDCCGVSLEFLQFRVNLRNESQFRFSFFLKGIGSFGTIRQPEGIF